MENVVVVVGPINDPRSPQCVVVTIETMADFPNINRSLCCMVRSMQANEGSVQQTQ